MDNTDSKKRIEEALAARSDGQVDVALEHLNAVLAVEPGNIEAAMLKVSILRKMGDRAGKLAAFRDAAEASPENIEVLLHYADAAASYEEAFAVLSRVRDLLGASAHQAHWLWQRMVNVRVSMNREGRGLDTSLASSWQDAHEALTLPEFENWRSNAALPLNDHGGYENLAALGAMHTEVGDDEKAAEAFRHAALIKPGRICDIVDIGGAFFEELERQPDQTLFENFSPLVPLRNQPLTDEKIIFLGCDSVYLLQFGVPLLRSLAKVSPRRGVHIHLLSVTKASWPQISEALDTIDLKVAVTGEKPVGFNAEPKLYYHSARYVRFYQLLTHYRRQMWIMDVDALMNRDPWPAFAGLDQRSIAVCMSPTALGPWNKIIAGLVGVSPTTEGNRFARMVAAYIAHWQRAGKQRWYMDQLALYGAYKYVAATSPELRTFFIQSSLMDQTERDDSRIWMASGSWKYTLQRMAAGESSGSKGLAERPYAKAFMSFSKASGDQ